MSALQVELPAELRSELEGLGLTDGPGVAAWVAEAVRRRLSADRQLRALEERAARGDRAAFDRVLAKVPPAEPDPADRW